MELMCLRCLSEGRMAFLGTRGSMSDSQVNYAICEGHLVQAGMNDRTSRASRSSHQENPTLQSMNLSVSDVSVTALH